MTSTTHRHRGRPKGSEIDDTKALGQIADLLIERRAHNVAAAVRLLAGNNPSLIRRLQRKFQRDHETLLSAALVKANQMALEEGARQNQLIRATRPLNWRHEHDATTQIMDALSLEREETLRKSFASNRGRPSVHMAKKSS